MYLYDLHLEKEVARTTICRTYWSSLVRTYDIQLGEVVSFRYVEQANNFDITVSKFVDNMKVEKPIVADGGKLFHKFNCFMSC